MSSVNAEQTCGHCAHAQPVRYARSSEPTGFVVCPLLKRPWEWRAPNLTCECNPPQFKAKQ